MKVNIFKLQILLKQFPFLEKILNEFDKNRIPDDISIKDAEPDLLAMVPRDHYFIENNGKEDHGEVWSFHIIDQLGNIHEPNASWRISKEGREVAKGNCTQTIEEQILALIKIKPEYILYIHSVYGVYKEGENEINSYEVVVYKMKEFDLSGYFLQQLDKAVEEIKDEIKALYK